MINKNRIIIKVIIILIIITTVIYLFIVNFCSKYMIEHSLGIKLPAKSEVEHYRYYFDWGIGHYKTKILLKSNDLSEIETQLNTVLEKLENPIDFLIPSANYSWWVSENSEVVSYYQLLTSYKKSLLPIPLPKTHEIYAFITHENDKYYLYITY